MGVINTNVVLTNFEKKMLEKLNTTDADGVITNQVVESDLYGTVIFEKETDEWVERTKFISVAGKYLNSAGIALNVTLVVVADKRFYMSLWNEEIKKATGKDLFINYIGHMQKIMWAMSNGMSDEKISEESDLLDNWGAL